MKIKHILLNSLITTFFVLALICGGAYLYAHTATWNSSYEASPGDTDAISEGAGKIRNLKRDVRERIAKDHYMAIAGTDADHGEHSKVTFQAPLGADPDPGANKGAIYTKDVSAKAELHWEDEDGDVVQLTSGGSWLASPFASGTKMVFYQDTCPTGWTIEDSLDDKLLFVTKGSAAGGETGGGAHSTGTWTQPNHNHTGPSHTHSLPIGVRSSSTGVLAYKNTQVSGTFTPTHNIAGGGNTQTANAFVSGSGGTGNTGDSATANTWRPAAYAVILCTKD